MQVQYYREFFNPMPMEGDHACVGDVADDLAGIWRDLKGGLTLSMPEMVPRQLGTGATTFEFIGGITRRVPCMRYMAG